MPGTILPSPPPATCPVCKHGDCSLIRFVADREAAAAQVMAVLR